MGSLRLFIRNLWRSTNMATKCLILVGFLALAETLASIFLDIDPTSPADVAIRSVMASIFGYIFGSKTAENANIANRNLQTLIASIVAITCMIASVASDWVEVSQTGSAAVEIRNLLFSAVGFLLSRAKSSE